MKKIFVAALLVACLALTGCDTVKLNVNGQQVDAGGAGTMVQTAKDNASVAACRTIRAQLDQQYTVAQSESLNAEVTVSFASLVKKLGVKCPSRGAYSFDEAAQKTKCSVHGE